jgi:hypothetical protein
MAPAHGGKNGPIACLLPHRHAKLILWQSVYKYFLKINFLEKAPTESVRLVGGREGGVIKDKREVLGGLGGRE